MSRELRDTQYKLNFRSRSSKLEAQSSKLNMAENNNNHRSPEPEKNQDRCCYQQQNDKDHYGCC
jgi:hypothetical protein